MLGSDEGGEDKQKVGENALEIIVQKEAED